MTVRCRGCDKPLTDINNSEAHIIPRALGGRLAPRDILCRNCNGLLNDAADLPLVKAFGAWPTLLNVPRQGSEQPSRTVQTRKGYNVSLDADGSMMRRDVVYDVTPTPEGHILEIGAGNMKTARQLIQRAKKQFPQLDVAEAEKHLKHVDLPLDDEIKLGLDFSPQAVFGGVLSGIWIYLIYTTGHTFIPMNDLLKRIRNMQEHGGLFRFLVDGLPGLHGPKIDLGHKIVVRAVPETGHLIIYMEIMGVLRIGGIFANGSPGTVVEHIYIYDLAQKADRTSEFSIDSAVFDVVDWRNVGLGPTKTDVEALRSHFAMQLNALADIYYRERLASAEFTETTPDDADTSPKATNANPTVT